MWDRITTFIRDELCDKDKSAYLDEIEDAIEESGKHVVFVCGDVVRDYLNMPTNSETVKIWRTRKTDKKFFVVTGTHPSWHLVFGGWQAARREFKRDMDIVRVLSKMNVNEVALLDEEALNAKIQAELDTSRRRR